MNNTHNIILTKAISDKINYDYNHMIQGILLNDPNGSCTATKQR